MKKERENNNEKWKRQYDVAEEGRKMNERQDLLNGKRNHPRIKLSEILMDSR